MSVVHFFVVVHLISDDSQACAEHRLDSVSVKTKLGSAVSVVLASEGYPGSYPKGRVITIGSVPSSESAGSCFITIGSHHPCRRCRLPRGNNAIQR